MAAVTADQVQTRMTAAEFLALPESNLVTELLEGEVFVSPAASDEHQKISGHIHLLLAQLISGGALRYAPADVQLDKHNVVQPDLFWVKEDNPHCRLENRRWRGAPDLGVEILAPGTARHDRGTKFELYEKHGVREYWLVEPEAQFVEVYVLREGRFVRQGLYEPKDTFTSPVLGEQTVETGKLFG
jgi:Uma2 family endonuclease